MCRYILFVGVCLLTILTLCMSNNPTKVKKKKITTANKYLDKVIDYYFDYDRKDSKVIKEMLKDCATTDRHEQLCYLITRDTQYGLGDTQWSKWLDILQ